MPDGGKPEDLSGEKSKLYIFGTSDFTKYFVPGFSKYNGIKGCNISMDLYFTSVLIIASVDENKFTIVKLMCRDKTFIPVEIKRA